MAKKKAPAGDEDNKVEPGESGTFQCTECNTEFAVVLEPKCAGTSESAKAARRATDADEVTCCPFCSGDVERC